ncbi:ACP phosphodiesterase [Microbulbifer halophilus]|uniref:ACP phosphodiesterase n=1 Tax=Microbulbifer halophilus TaxID=453963 RepID=A0ABW5E9K4_9GAMM|nr:ACP phosphodiesterase [Microbulbifer halophilus]MCW8125505.1 ACP phosphodiesterase [Microbulbifer halophilus]
MNYLAHLLLSGPDPDWRLGGLLGDFVKGPLRGERPAAIEAGIHLHRRIDATTDDHPAYRDSLTLLDPQWRRYAGIVLDIWFDHLLNRQWPHWHPQPLQAFCDQCWRDFHARSRYIPPRALTFMQRAEEYRLLESYGDPTVIRRTLERVGQRLRRPVPLQETLPELRAADSALHENFEWLLTDLNREAARFRQHYPVGNK